MRMGRKRRSWSAASAVPLLAPLSSGQGQQSPRPRLQLVAPTWSAGRTRVRTAPVTLSPAGRPSAPGGCRCQAALNGPWPAGGGPGQGRLAERAPSGQSPRVCLVREDDGAAWSHLDEEEGFPGVCSSGKSRALRVHGCAQAGCPVCLGDTGLCGRPGDLAGDPAGLESRGLSWACRSGGGVP